MEIKNKNDLKTYLEAKKGEYNFIINTLKFFAIVKIKDGKIELPPEFDNNILNDQTNEWFDGIIFNKNEQIKFQRIANDKYILTEYSNNQDENNYIEKEYLLLGLPEKNDKDNKWTYMNEYSIKGYWIPGKFSKNKIAIKGKEIIEYNEYNNAYVSDIIFSEIIEK